MEALSVNIKTPKYVEIRRLISRIKLRTRRQTHSRYELIYPTSEKHK